MSKFKISTLILIFALPSLFAQDMGSEDITKQADERWLAGKPQDAVLLYQEALDLLQPEQEGFRSFIIMRMAQSQLAAGNNIGSTEALGLLEEMEYVPEHHALVAEEMKAVIAGGVYPGHQKTAIPAVGAIKANIYVSSVAKTEGDGSRENPFSRVVDAVKLARKYRISPSEGAVVINVDPGRYLITESIKLTAADAGSEQAPLVIRSTDPHNEATLTGGVVLKDWKPVEDPSVLNRLQPEVRAQVLVCDLTAHEIKGIGELVFGGFSSLRAKPGSHRFDTFPIPELFYQGNPQRLARWPNDSLSRLAIDEIPEQKNPRSDLWSQENDLWLYGYWKHDWADAYEKVDSIDPTGKINLVEPTNRYGFEQRLGCVINALSELDAPGEWKLDTKENRIYFLPPPAFDSNEVILSTAMAPLIAEQCDHLQLRNLNVDYVRGDAMIFKDCSDLLLTSIHIQHASGLGMKIDGGKRHLIHSCKINSMGRGGVDIQAGDWKKLIPAHSVIENCQLSNLSRIDRTYTPALLLEGMGINVRHNSFIDIPSSAIRVEACDTLIELNYFNHCVYESGDQGAIDMWANPLYRGNVIRWNDFDRIINNHSHYGAAAIRHDDYICGFMTYQNIMRKGSEKGFGIVQFNRGTDSYVEGNIIIDWHKAFTGISILGEEWTKQITEHSNSKKMIEETPWQSEAWKNKYPMVKDLLNGDDNKNYVIDNLRLGTGEEGILYHSVSFLNREGDKAFDATEIESVKSKLTPWRTIPIDLIGTY